jgi:hypothetical protein
MGGPVALVTPPVRIGPHLLAYRLATALDLDAVQHRPQFLASVDCEHLADAVAFLVPVFEPHQPAGVVGAELPVPLERKLAHLASEHHHANGLAVGVDGSRHVIQYEVELGWMQPDGSVLDSDGNPVVRRPGVIRLNFGESG